MITKMITFWYRVRRVNNENNEVVGSFQSNNEKAARNCFRQWVNGNRKRNYTIEYWLTNRKGEWVKKFSVNGLTGMSYRDIIESSKERKN
jgi:hypothetical protein